MRNPSAANSAILQLIDTNTQGLRGTVRLLQEVAQTTARTEASVGAMADLLKDMDSRLDDVEMAKAHKEGLPGSWRNTILAAGTLLTIFAGAMDFSCATRDDVPPLNTPRISFPLPEGGTGPHPRPED